MAKIITFWEQLDGRIVVQKDNAFFAIPEAATQAVSDDDTLRQSIAENFDTAPFKQETFELSGARVMARIEVDA